MILFLAAAVGYVLSMAVLEVVHYTANVARENLAKKAKMDHAEAEKVRLDNAFKQMIDLGLMQKGDHLTPTYIPLVMQPGDEDPRVTVANAAQNLTEDQTMACAAIATLVRGMARLPLMVQTVKIFSEGTISIQDKKVTTAGMVLQEPYCLTEAVERSLSNTIS